MRVLWLVILAACELRPAPKPEPAPVVPLVPPEASAGADAAAAGPALIGSAMGSGVSPPCLEVGRHVADVMIASAKDTGDRSVLEQERDNTVRKTAEGCTTLSWSPAMIECYMATKTPADIKACAVKFAAPPS